MMKFLLSAVLATVVSAAVGAEQNGPLWLDCSRPDALQKLEREIRERKHNDRLLILHLWSSNVIPELPNHEFRAISVTGPGSDGVFDLTPLVEHTPKFLGLSNGTFLNLAALRTAKIENLSASIDSVLHADDISRGDWSSLKNLTLHSVRGEVLDLQSAVKLEDLGFFGGNRNLVVRFAPQLRLKELSVSGTHLPLLRAIHTGELKSLFIISSETADYAPLAEVELPELTYLGCHAASGAPCRLPFMPKLKKLELEDFPAVSLKHLRSQCPALEHLRMTNIPTVTEWEELSKMPLKRLHIARCGGVKYSLPVSTPAGCRVTGLPGFTENPYKMWSAWAASTLLFGAWTFCRRRRKPKSDGEAKWRS